jgi:predicted DNA-binding protein (UPF0251 family)
LFGVAHRIALKARNKRNRQRGRENPLPDVAENRETPPEADVPEIVQHAVSKLPEVYRAAIVACDLQGLSRKDAAAQLGWSEGTLSGRLARARVILAARLRRTGLAVPAAVLTAGAVPGVASAILVRDTVALLSNTNSLLAAPVAQLAESVVTNMVISKAKAVVAVVVIACAVTFGAVVTTHVRTDVPPVVAANSVPPQTPNATPSEIAPPPRLKPPLRGDLAMLQGKWVIASWRHFEDGKPSTPPFAGIVEVKGTTIQLPMRLYWAGLEASDYTLVLDEKPTPRTLDFTANSEPVSRAIYRTSFTQVNCTACHQSQEVSRKLRALQLSCPPFAENATTAFQQTWELAISTKPKYPADFGGKSAVVLQLVRADAEISNLLQVIQSEMRLRLKIQLAEKERERDLVRRLESVTYSLHVAKRRLEIAKAMLPFSSKFLEEAQQDYAKVDAAYKEAVKDYHQVTFISDMRSMILLPQDTSPAFTVHIRTLSAAEKVVRVKATAKETVLDAMFYANDDVSFQKDTLSVWIVRDGKRLPVDLLAITQNNDAKTNYTLQPGDQLFVQVQPK